jgi:multidrug efflux pump subunit AcrB
MNIPAAFIRQPVATALLMVAIVLLGATAYQRLPVAALPNVAFPTIAVTAQLPGADPQTMASSVATPLEKQFGQIPYLTQMTSTSSLGYAQIVLQFALNDDINAAAQLVQTAINAAAGQLPKNLPSPPTYHETNPSDAPILVLGLTSDTLPSRRWTTTPKHSGTEAIASTGRRACRRGRYAAAGNSYSVQSGATRGEWPFPGGCADGTDKCERGSA